MLDSMIRFINQYAYAEVAIYGKGFCDAGKDALSLLASFGLDVIVADDLIGSVLIVAVIFVGFASFGIGYGVFLALSPASGLQLLVAIAALFVGYGIFFFSFSFSHAQTNIFFFFLKCDDHDRGFGHH